MSDRPTVKLTPLELSTLVQGSTTQTTEIEPIEADAITVEMLPIELGIPDPEREDGLPAVDPVQLARGSDAVPPQQKPLVHPRGPRRARETLRVEDIDPSKPKTRG